MEWTLKLDTGARKVTQSLVLLSTDLQGKYKGANYWSIHQLWGYEYFIWQQQNSKVVELNYKKITEMSCQPG